MNAGRNQLWIISSFALLIMGCAGQPDLGKFPEAAGKAGSTCSANRIENQFIVQWSSGRISVVKSKSLDEFKKTVLIPKDKLINFVEFDKKVYSDAVVNGLPVSHGPTWGQDSISAGAVWARGFRGSGAKVAVVDAGVDVFHPQIQPRIAINTAELNGKEGVDDDRNGFVDDIYGWDFVTQSPRSAPAAQSMDDHGTHVAGIMIADHRTGPAIGVAPEAQLIVASFISNNEGGSISDSISALRYAADRGANVINASWGGASCSTLLRNTIAELESRNILVVAASGNSGVVLDQVPQYPAAFVLPNLLTISAISWSGRQTSWSNKSFQLVHLGAPGDAILSTVQGGGYAYMSGTSMAAPFVSGAAAVLWGARPGARVAQIRQALISGVDLGDQQNAARGSLNLDKALRAIEQSVAP